MNRLLFLTALLFSTLFYVEEITGQNSGNYLVGHIIDSNTGETVIGATVYFPDIDKGASTDIEGNYKVENLFVGKYVAQISCIGYKTIIIPDMVVREGKNSFDVVMEEAVNLLDQIVVTSVKRMNSQIAMVQATKTASVVMSGVSGKQISKSQDRNAAEVVRRIPGVTVINDRHIIVRGLPSRYNNVWINNSSAPSTETDSRSFSFDMMPSSQLESIQIIKSQSADLPADFSGGFVKLTTGGMPDKNETQISVGTGFNTITHFNNQFVNAGSSTDFLGFDNGKRALSNFVSQRMDNDDKQEVSKVTKEGFNENWTVEERNTLPDMRLSLLLNRAYKLKKGSELGLLGLINYSHSSQSYIDMQNARFGVYNSVQDKPEYIYNYTDNQYSVNSKTGAMLNLVWMDENNKIEFKNLFNLHGKNRYSTREGWQNVSALYLQEKYEYLYTSRSNYLGQFAGRHDFDSNTKTIDWNLTYSYANMSQPDRRIINREENQIFGDQDYGKMSIDQNEITRDFISLKEYIVSPSLNYTHSISSLKSDVKIKAGFLLEYRSRKNTNRQFYYRFNRSNVPANFVYGDVVTDILVAQNYDADKLYLYEDTDNRNSYNGKIYNSAGYLSYSMKREKFNVTGGIRVEAGRISLESYDRIYEFTTITKNHDIVEVYPSLNASYNISNKNLIRFAYGRSTNKQELRELSSSVYYDFNLFSDVKGNPDLKHAIINNIDLRFEHYPSPGEYVTLALFYKHFKNPIEWTYLDAGGSYTYTFENAVAANNWGIEADIRKELKFIGLDNFTLGLNASYIISKVVFDKDSSLEQDRAMQGQSPYIINSSLLYDNQKLGISAGVLYNRIGRRIVGVGRADIGSGASINNDVPDTYEFPRDIIDITISKIISKNAVLKLRATDILNQKIIFQQYPKYIDDGGVVQNRNQISKSFYIGSSFSLSLQLSF
ncbi:MAG: outer membrane beta-barrel protein [Bacteroidales bacterium]